MDTVPRYNVAIVGAGWYGLVAARTYLRLRPDVNVIILDNDSTVGGVWSKKRLYPNLVAQVKHGLFNYTDTPMPGRGRTKNDMVTGDMIHNYLQTFAEDHDLLRRIRFNTFVDRVERCPDGGPGGWRVHFHDPRGGASEEEDDHGRGMLDADKLMVATGVTSIPRYPALAGGNDGSVPIIHSRDFGESNASLRSEKVRDVVVLGAAKSAYDAVYLLLRMGKRVTWVIRPHGAGPLAMLPSEVLGWWNSIAVASTRLMTFLSPSILNAEGWLAWLLLRSWPGRLLVALFWTVLDRLSAAHAGYGRGDHVAGLKPEIGDKSIFWANSGLGVVTLPDFWQTLHDGDVRIVREDPHHVAGGRLHFASGSDVAANSIVACTGWGDHFAMFDGALKAEFGLPAVADPRAPGAEARLRAATDPEWAADDARAAATVAAKLPLIARSPALRNPATNEVYACAWRLYRRSIPYTLGVRGDRSLAIMGQIHTVQTPLVSEMQSFWTILYLLGETDLPPAHEMRREIAEWNAWTRMRYLSQGRKFPYSLYDFLPYVDSLCKDLGIKSRRKGNPVSELFSPYRPEDFNGFIDEYLASRGDLESK
ncbi:dimethylaniline monooxygenase (N-oxide forming) [Microdochium nivale]|nr:dimethylaniline monooxygenase (N-oxide forming) [Microdochium nivale]